MTDKEKLEKIVEVMEKNSYDQPIGAGWCKKVLSETRYNHVAQQILEALNESK